MSSEAMSSEAMLVGLSIRHAQYLMTIQCCSLALTTSYAKWLY